MRTIRPGVDTDETVEPLQAPSALLTHSGAAWAGIVLAALAVLAGLYGGRTAPSDEVDGYGLISAFQPVYWFGVLLAAVATAILFRQATRERIGYAAVVPIMWLLVLHTGPHLAHAHFRFQTAWTHMGFVRLIDNEAAGDVMIDVRFAWPGFFGTFAAPLGSADPALVEVVMRLWPTAILGATAILISALASRSYPTVPLIGPLSATVYLLLAWTGQDYFSPQSFGFTVYLSILVLIESGPLRTSPAWSASVPFLARFAAAGGDRPRSRNPAVFVAIVILAFGAIVSHPLAPFFICMGMVILGLYGRSVAWRLLVMVGVAYVLWFFVTAEPWWATQLASMIDQMGSFFGNLSETTTERVSDASPEHLFVTQVRSVMGIGTIVAVLAIGIAMATDRFKHLRPAVPLAPLAGIPSMALALQSYGGEIIFRVVLFTLPMAAILIGRVLAAVRVRALPLVVPAVALALTPPLLVARFGNEAFEMTTAVDREVFDAGFAEAGDDVLFVLDNGFAPYQDRTVGRNRFAEIRMEPTQEWLDLVEIVADLAGKPRIIVFITPSQTEYRIHGWGSPPDYLDDMGEWLKARPGSRVIYESDEGGLAIEL